MQTQGANSPGPITAAGILIGSIWSILSTVAFFGVIIGTLYAYFMLPRRRPSREIIGALQYNLEQLENLSVDELELLRDTTVRIVNTQIGELKQKSSGQWRDADNRHLMFNRNNNNTGDHISYPVLLLAGWVLAGWFVAWLSITYIAAASECH